MGRITFNPLAHLDLFGTLILPLFLVITDAPYLFGWAKPVPVRYEALRGGRKGMAWVSLAGPLANFLMAVASALVFRLLRSAFRDGWIGEAGLAGLVGEPVLQMAAVSAHFNLVLTVVNLLPIPPLDGGRVLCGWLPERWGKTLEGLERYGLLIVLLLMMTGIWGYIMRPFTRVFVGWFLG
jgi:Zn-dependent protease